MRQVYFIDKIQSLAQMSYLMLVVRLINLRQNLTKQQNHHQQNQQQQQQQLHQQTIINDGEMK